MWCNKIKRQDGKDGFRVNESTRVCEKHFESFKIYRPPGGTRWRLIDGARPLLHRWNSFSLGRNKRKSPTKRHELSFIDNIIDNKRKKESGIDSSSSEKCVPENPTLEMTSSVDKSETTEQLADAPGKSNAENKENISSSDLNKPSCSGVNINMSNNILEQISILGLAVEIQTLREENERLRDQVRDFQAQDKAQ